MPDAPPDLTLTRSEERLRAFTETVATERIRLEKFVVTEERTVTVMVRREEVRLVREPIIDGPVTVPDDSPDLDLVLHEERLVVTKEVVPVERVRLRKHSVTEDRLVEATLRSERIDAPGMTAGH